MKFIFNIAQRLFGDTLVTPLRLLSGGSFVRLLQRLTRIRDVAGNIAHGGVRPPMPVRLQVETTDVCNLKCRMCTREVLTGMNSIDMELDQFQSLVTQIDPYYVTLNGLGEPLVDKTVFDKLSFLHERGIMTSMPTNGTYVRRNKLEGLAKNLPDILQLSIDGAAKESFEYVRAEGDFNMIIGNYRKIVERKRLGQTRPGTKIRILCALQKRNLFDFADMYKLVQSMPGLDSFDLVPVFDYDAEGSTFAHLIPTREDVLEVQSQLDRAIAGTADEKEKEFYRRWHKTSSKWLDGTNGSVEAATNTHACLVPWFNAYVDAKGRVYPCCYLTNSENEMGNINKQAFADIWHGDKYVNFRTRLMTDRPTVNGCSTCPRNDDNRIRQITRLGPVLTKGEASLAAN